MKTSKMSNSRVKQFDSAVGFSNAQESRAGARDSVLGVAGSQKASAGGAADDTDDMSGGQNVAYIPGLTSNEILKLRRKFKCTEQELKEFKEIFNLVDRDAGGTISAEELGELMETLGIHATEDDIEAMIEEIDLDSNGEIDFEEFVAVMSRKIQADYTAEDVKNSFKVFEGTAPRGMIVAEDLVAALSSYGDEKLSQEEARDLVNQLEPDPNGMINYTDYVDMMMAHSSPDGVKRDHRGSASSKRSKQ